MINKLMKKAHARQREQAHRAEKFLIGKKGSGVYFERGIIWQISQSF